MNLVMEWEWFIKDFLKFLALYVLGFSIGFLLGHPLGIVTLGRYRAGKRKKVQEDIVKKKGDMLEQGRWFPVRYSSEAQFRPLLKSSLWEGTGNLFINDTRAIFFGDLDEWKNIESVFAPENSRIKWIGRNVWRYGFAFWFKIRRHYEKHYFTSETGAALRGSEKTTQEIYDELRKVFSS